MSNSNSITNNLLQAISIIAQQKVNSAKFDKTIQATIISCVDATIGKYKVRYQDGYWYAYSQSVDVNYSPGSNVYVLIPQGDMSNYKTIIGTTQKLGTNYINIQSKDSGFVTVGNNVITNVDSNSLCSYKTKTKVLYDADTAEMSSDTISIDSDVASFANNTLTVDSTVSSISSSTFNIDADVIGYANNTLMVDPVAASQYIKSSSYVMISAIVRTAIPAEQRYGGNYGLKFYLDFKSSSTEDTVTRLYTFDIDSMQGNPYSLINPTKQIGFFEVDKQNFIRIRRIEAFVVGFPVQEAGHPDDIFLSQVSLTGANALTEAQKNGVSLNLIMKKGYIFNQGSLDTDTRTVQAEVRVKMRAIDNQSQNLPFYWFIENTNVVPGSTYYSQYGGQGWKCLNEYTVVQEASGDDPAVYQFNPGSYLFTVAKTDVQTQYTKYKCVVIYGQNLYSKQFTIINDDFDYSIQISSDSGTQFSYDIGSPTLTCSIFDQAEELDPDDYIFVWSQIDSSGAFSSLPETTELNTEYAGLVQDYNDLKHDLDTQAVWHNGTYSGSVTNDQKLQSLAAQILAYDGIQRVSAANIYHVDIKQITGFTTFKCSVFAQSTGALVGTASIVISNSLEADGLYKLIINNSAQVFNYTQDGVSPTNSSFENPYEIPALSFTIYDDKGNPIADNIASNCTIKWIVPQQNTMLVIPDSYQGQLTEDETKKIYTGYMNLAYQITDKYYVNKTNNTIQLNVQYNQLNLIAQTNLTFTKQGQSGTNGTDYQIRVVPYVRTGNAPDYPTVYVDSSSITTNWTHKDGTGNGVWFKVELWHNGQLIYNSNVGSTNNDSNTYSQEGKPVSIEWSVLKNSYAASILDPTCITIDSSTGSITYDGSSLNTSNYVPSNIVKATVKYDGLTYYATIPVISVKRTSNIYKANLKKNTGFRYAIYKDDGTQPVYDNRNPFEIIVEMLLGNGNYEDISLSTTSAETTYTWSYIGRYYNRSSSSWVNQTYLGNDKSYATVQKNQHWVKPLDDYSGQIVNSAIVINIAVSGTNVLYVHIPVHLYLNRYTNKALNGWDGNSIDLGGNNTGAIIAPQVGAGIKEQDNSFTGIVIGKVRGDTFGVNDIQNGLFGYKSGQRTIFLDAATGKAVFGKNNAGQIIINPGTQAVIKGGNYIQATGTTAGSGMLIDLTTPEIKFGSGNFSVDSSGHLNATGATISGAITATSLTLGSGVTIPYGSVSGAPDLTLYIKKDGTIGSTPASGSTGFVVSSAGLLQASNAVIYGTIYAGSGTIGGFTIDSTSIHTASVDITSNATNSVGLSSSTFQRTIGGTSRSDLKFAIGSKFGVSNDGTLYAGGAVITGGSINISTSSATADVIKLTYGEFVHIISTYSNTIDHIVNNNMINHTNQNAESFMACGSGNNRIKMSCSGTDSAELNIYDNSSILSNRCQITQDNIYMWNSSIQKTVSINDTTPYIRLSNPNATTIRLEGDVGKIYCSSYGAANTNSYGALYLGNDKTQSTAGQSTGNIVMFGYQGYYHDIYAVNTMTANRSLRLPDASGTVALTSQAVNNITASGMTCTATKADGSTFTFTPSYASYATSGNWKRLKFTNGIQILWCYQTVSVDITSAWGYGYEGRLGWWSFPWAFSSTPTITASIQSTSSGVILEHTGNGSTTGTQTYWAYRASSASGVSLTIGIMAIGSTSV